jgi:23S rRNA-intervening sequence protein
VFRDRDIGGAATMNSVEDLDVFKLAHELALKIYSVTKKFPREETYSLIDQRNLPGTAFRLRPRHSNAVSPVAVLRKRTTNTITVVVRPRLTSAPNPRPAPTITSFCRIRSRLFRFHPLSLCPYPVKLAHDHGFSPIHEHDIYVFKNALARNPPNPVDCEKNFTRDLAHSTDQTP